MKLTPQFIIPSCSWGDLYSTDRIILSFCCLRSAQQVAVLPSRRSLVRLLELFSVQIDEWSNVDPLFLEIWRTSVKSVLGPALAVSRSAKGDPLWPISLGVDLYPR